MSSIFTPAEEAPLGQPLTFRQIRDVHRGAAGPFADLNIQEFSKLLNFGTRSPEYAAAGDDGLFGRSLKYASAGIDDFLDSIIPGGLKKLGDFGASIGARFGAEEGGRMVGETLPRQLINFIPFLLSGPVGWGAAGVATAADVYEKTDRPGAALTAGALAAATPLIARAGGQAALGFGRKFLPGTFGRGLSQVATEAAEAGLTGKALAAANRAAFDGLTVGEKLTSFVGSNVAAELPFLTSDWIQSGLPFDEFISDPNYLFATLASSIPFAGVEATQTFQPTPKVVHDLRRKILIKRDADAAAVDTDFRQQSADAAREASPIPEAVDHPDPTMPPPSDPPTGELGVTSFEARIGERMNYFTDLRKAALDRVNESGLTDSDKALQVQRVEAEYNRLWKEAFEKIENDPEKLFHRVLKTEVELDRTLRGVNESSGNYESMRSALSDINQPLDGETASLLFKAEGGDGELPAGLVDYLDQNPIEVPKTGKDFRQKLDGLMEHVTDEKLSYFGGDRGESLVALREILSKPRDVESAYEVIEQAADVAVEAQLEPPRNGALKDNVEFETESLGASIEEATERAASAAAEKVLLEADLQAEAYGVTPDMLAFAKAQTAKRVELEKVEVTRKPRKKVADEPLGLYKLPKESTGEKLAASLERRNELEDKIRQLGKTAESQLADVKGIKRTEFGGKRTSAAKVESLMKEFEVVEKKLAEAHKAMPGSGVPITSIKAAQFRDLARQDLIGAQAWLGTQRAITRRILQGGVTEAHLRDVVSKHEAEALAKSLKSNYEIVYILYNGDIPAHFPQDRGAFGKIVARSHSVAQSVLNAMMVERGVKMGTIPREPVSAGKPDLVAAPAKPKVSQEEQTIKDAFLSQDVVITVDETQGPTVLPTDKGFSVNPKRITWAYKQKPWEGPGKFGPYDIGPNPSLKDFTRFLAEYAKLGDIPDINTRNQEAAKSFRAKWENAPDEVKTDPISKLIDDFEAATKAGEFTETTFAQPKREKTRLKDPRITEGADTATRRSDETLRFAQQIKNPEIRRWFQEGTFESEFEKLLTKGIRLDDGTLAYANSKLHQQFLKRTPTRARYDQLVTKHEGKGLALNTDKTSKIIQAFPGTKSFRDSLKTAYRLGFQARNQRIDFIETGFRQAGVDITRVKLDQNADYPTGFREAFRIAKGKAWGAKRKAQSGESSESTPLMNPPTGKAPKATRSESGEVVKAFAVEGSEAVGGVPGMLKPQQTPYERAVDWMLADVGLGKGERAEAMEVLRRTYDLLGGDEVDFGVLINDVLVGGKELAGLSQLTQDGIRRVWLGRAKMLGELPKQKQVQMARFVLGHEMLHGVVELGLRGELPESGRKAFETWQKKVEKMDGEEAREMLEMLADEADIAPIAKDAMLRDADDPVELMANLGALYSLKVADGKMDDFALGFMPHEQVGFMGWVTRWGRRVVGAARATLARFGVGRAKMAGEVLTDGVKFFDKMIGNFKKYDKTFEEVQKLAAWSEHTPMDMRVSALQVLGGKLVDSSGQRFDPFGLGVDKHDVKAAKKGAARLASRLMERMEDLVSRVPGLDRPGMAAMAHPGMIRGLAKRAWGNMWGGTTKNGGLNLNSPEGKAFKRASKQGDKEVNQKLKDSVFKMEEIKQQMRARGLDTEGLTAKDLVQQGKKLSPEDMEVVEGVLQRGYDTISRVLDEELRYSLETSGWEGARLFLAPKLSHKLGMAEISKLADEFVQVIAHQVDPTLAELGAQYAPQQLQLLRKFQDLGEVEAFRDMFDFMKARLEGREQLRKLYDERKSAGWWPQVQSGSHKVSYYKSVDQFDAATGTTKKVKKEFRKFVQSEAQATRVAERLQKEGLEVIGWEKVNKAELYRDLDPDWGNHIDKVDRQLAERIDRADIDPELKEELKQTMSLKTEYQKAIANEHLPTSDVGHSKLDPERADPLDSLRAWVGIKTGTMMTQLMNARLGFELQAPVLKNHPEQVAQFKQMIENYKQPDTELGRTISKATFQYFLALNLSNHAMEFMQPAFSGWPQLVAEGFGRIKAARMLASFSKDAFKYNAKALRYKNGEDVAHLWTEILKDDGIFAAYFQKGMDEGALNLGHISDHVGHDITEAGKFDQAARTGVIPKIWDVAKMPVQALAHLGSATYASVVRHNAFISLRAGLEVAKKHLPNEPLLVKDPAQGDKLVANPRVFEEALLHMAQTTMNSGRAGRPELPFKGGRSGAWRTAGQASMALTSYYLGQLGNMARYAQRGYGKKYDATYVERVKTDLKSENPKLTGEALEAAAKGKLAEMKKHHRKALHSMMAVQFGGAGLLGLPFIGAAIAIAEANSDLEINKSMREGLAQLFGDMDGDNGTMTDIILHGLGTGLTPMDFGSRFAMGGILGTNAYNGFDPKGVFGPAFSLAENVLTGFKQLGQGLTTEGVDGNQLGLAAQSMAPIAWKKVIDLARGGGELTDQEGGKLLDLTEAERFTYAIGFNPSRVARLKSTERILRRSRDIMRRREIAFHDDVAAQIRTDPAGARRALLDRESMSEGTYSASAGARRVAERIEKQTLPRDPRRDAPLANAQVESQYHRTTNAAGYGATEMERLQIQQAVMAQLGFAEPLTPGQVAQAQAVDRMMAANPFMTRAEAIQRFERGNQRSRRFGQR